MTSAQRWVAENTLEQVEGWSDCLVGRGEKVLELVIETAVGLVCHTPWIES